MARPSFASLPLEVREIIYRYATSREQGYELYNLRMGHYTPDIAEVMVLVDSNAKSRICQEATRMFLRSNKFIVEGRSLHHGLLHAVTSGIHLIHAPRPKLLTQLLQHLEVSFRYSELYQQYLFT